MRRDGLFVGVGQGLKLGTVVRPVSVSPEHGAIKNFVSHMGIYILPNDLIMGSRGQFKKPAHIAVTNQRVSIGQPL